MKELINTLNNAIYLFSKQQSLLHQIRATKVTDI